MQVLFMCFIQTLLQLLVSDILYMTTYLMKCKHQVVIELIWSFRIELQGMNMKPDLHW